jgi:xanthine dehydrogenase YagS FAD-binding subunit
MKPYRYERADDTTGAVALLAQEPNAKFLAGGTNLVDLPPLDFATNSRYHKVRDRASYAFALVSVAAALDVADGIVRIAFGGLAHKPWRATKAEEVLREAPAIEDTFRRAADAELADAQPLADNAFKVPLARNTLVGVLRDLTEEGG